MSKLTKRVLSMLIVAFMVISMIPATTLAAETGSEAETLSTESTVSTEFKSNWCDACKKSVTWEAFPTSGTKEKWIGAGGGHFYLTGDSTYTSDGMTVAGPTCFHTNGYTLKPLDDDGYTDRTAFNVRAELNLLGDGTIVGNGGSAVYSNQTADNQTAHVHIYGPTVENTEAGGTGEAVVVYENAKSPSANVTLHSGLVKGMNYYAIRMNTSKLTIKGGAVKGNIILGNAAAERLPTAEITGGTVDSYIHYCEAGRDANITVGNGYIKHLLTDVSNAAIVTGGDHPVVKNYAYCEGCKSVQKWTAMSTTLSTPYLTGGHYYLTGNTSYTGDAMGFTAGTTCFHTNGYNLEPSKEGKGTGQTAFSVRAKVNLLGNGTVIGNGASAIHLGGDAADVNIYGPTLKNHTDGDNPGLVIFTWGVAGKVTLHDGLMIADGTQKVIELNKFTLTVNGGKIKGGYIAKSNSPVIAINGGTVDAYIAGDANNITVADGYVKNTLLNVSGTYVTKADADKTSVSENGIGYCEACEGWAQWTGWETTWTGCKYINGGHYYLTGDTTYVGDGVAFMSGTNCFHNNGHTLKPAASEDSRDDRGQTAINSRTKVNLMGNGTIIGNGNCALYNGAEGADTHIYGGTYKNYFTNGKVITGNGYAGTITLHDGLLEAGENVADLNNIKLVVYGGKIIGTYITMSNWTNSAEIYGGTIGAYFRGYAGYDTYDKITVGEGYVKQAMGDERLSTIVAKEGELGTLNAWCEACEDYVTWLPYDENTYGGGKDAGGNLHLYLKEDTVHTQSHALVSYSANPICFNLNGHNLTSGAAADAATFVCRTLNIQGEGTVTSGANCAVFHCNGNSSFNLNIYGGTYKRPTNGTNSILKLYGSIGGIACNFYGGTIDATDGTGAAVEVMGSIKNDVENIATLNVKGGKILAGGADAVYISKTYGRLNVTEGTVDGYITGIIDNATAGTGYAKYTVDNKVVIADANVETFGPGWLAVDSEELVSVNTKIENATGMKDLKVEILDAAGTVLTTVTPETYVVPETIDSVNICAMVLGDSDAWQQDNYFTVDSVPASAKLYVNNMTVPVKTCVINGSDQATQLTPAEWAQYCTKKAINIDYLQTFDGAEDTILDETIWGLETDQLQGTAPTIADGVMTMGVGDSVKFNWNKVPEVGGFNANTVYTFEFDAKITSEGDANESGNILYVAPGGWFNQIELGDQVRAGDTYGTYESDKYLNKTVHVEMQWVGNTITSTITDAEGNVLLTGYRTSGSYSDMSANNAAMTYLVLRCEKGEVEVDNFSFKTSNIQKAFSDALTVTAGKSAVYSCDIDVQSASQYSIKLNADETTSIFDLRNNVLKLCGVPVEGTYGQGKYKVTIYLNAESDIGYVEVTLPDGGSVKRGTHAIMDNVKDGAVLEASSYDEAAISNVSLTYADNLPLEEVEYKWVQSPTGFKANVYNLMTSFDDAATTRNFAWTAKASFIGEEEMAVRYRVAGTETWTVYTALKHNDSLEAKEFFYADITGLTAGTTYEYQVGKKNSTDETNDWSQVYTFTTAEEEVSEFTFMGVADVQIYDWAASHLGGAPSYEVIWEQIRKNNETPAFLVNMGDTGENDYAFDWYFRAMGDSAATVPQFHVMGNHDYFHVDSEYKDFYANYYFNHPGNGTNAIDSEIASQITNAPLAAFAKNYGESIYSYDYGNVHFVTLNTSNYNNRADDALFVQAQRDWLIADLEANKDAKWTVVMMHMPVYDINASPDYVSYGAAAFKDIIEGYGVDLVIAGHVHSLQRTYPMKDGQIVTRENPNAIVKDAGTVYLTLPVVSDSHHQLTDDPINTDEYYTMITPAEEQAAYSMFDVSDNQIKVVTRQIDGSIIDEFTITEQEAVCEIGGTGYATLEKALDAAGIGDTIKLNAACTEESVVIRSGITLDLNGCTLTADEVLSSAADGKIIDSTNGTGLLKVARGNLTLVDNDQMMVWIEEDSGYRFADVSFTDYMQEEAAGKATYSFWMDGTDPEYIIANELGDGAEDNDGLDLVVRVNYTSSSGKPLSLDVVFRAEDLKAYGKYYSTGCLWVSVIGLEKVSNVTFTPILSNGSLAIAGDAAAYN